MKRYILEIGPGIRPMIKKEYGDHVEVFMGDRRELLQIESDSIDELVALGTFGEPSETLSEFKRVLRSGGILLLGTSSEIAASDQFANTWKLSLADNSFVEVPEMKMSYDYFPQPGSPERPYVVTGFQKN